MVLGLFEGSIEVKTDKHQYNRGETINCSCTLKLPQSIDARGLRATLEQLMRHGKGSRYVEIARKELGAARTYRDGERFEFSFLVDEKAAPDFTKLNGIMGDIQMFSCQPICKLSLVRVSLDMPMKLDVESHVFLDINRPIIQKQ